jgi:hypothetical protein
MGRERPGALLARRTRTVKLGSFDARSEGRFAYSLGEVENRWESLDACGEGHEVEQDSTPLDLVRTRVRNYLAATISRSSISNTNVAPGLIRGGRPLSL